MLNDSDRPEADLPLEMHMGLESLLISLLVEAPVSMALAILERRLDWRRERAEMVVIVLAVSFVMGLSSGWSIHLRS